MGCNSTQEIMVEFSEKENFKYLELFPNPTHDWFVVRIDLCRTANVNILITDISGKILKQKQLYNNCFYWYSDNIQRPGIYLIVLSSEYDNKTLKLVVH
jgi:hypothetical protein